MDSENQDRCSPERSKPDETPEGTHKQIKISYARDFLLSLAELGKCKNLPSGFDSSLLSEFDDPNTSMSECQRVVSNLSLHSFKSSVYASSQSDHNSDSGQQNIKRYRCPGLKYEYRGVLGTPRVYAGAQRASAQTAQGSGFYQLDRHKEPCGPSHPFKIVCGLGKGNIDSYNDETFGCAEYLDHETAEEEKRRVSFELMRKEQEKAIQGQKKQNVDEHKAEFDPNNRILLKDSGNDNSMANTINESEQCLILPASTDDSAEVSLPARVPALTPLIPPGFSDRILEKNRGTKPLIHSPISEHDDGKAECPGMSMVYSSKFAHMLCEEEKKPAVVISSSKEEGGTQLSRMKTAEITDHNFPNVFSEINQLTCKLKVSTSTSAREQISGQAVSCNKSSVTPGVLTCEDLEQSIFSVEDLEQSIFSDMKENNTTQSLLVQNWSLYAKDDKPNSANSNVSSQHLLSLVQGGVSLKDMTTATNKLFHPVVDKCSRSTVTDSEDMVASELSNPGQFNLIEETQTDSEQDSTLGSIAGFDEKDGSTIEICLPEEDIFITVDDPIIPQRSMFKPTWNSLEPDFSAPVDDIVVQGTDLNHVSSDEISAIRSLESSPLLHSYCDPFLRSSCDPSLHSSCDRMGSKIPYGNLCAQKSFPLFRYPHMDPQRPSNYPLDSPQLSSQVRSMDWKNYYLSPQMLHYKPENVHTQPSFTHTPAAPTRFHYPVHDSLQQYMHGSFHVNQPKLSMQKFPQHHQQPGYGGFSMTNTGPAVHGKCNAGARQTYPYAVDEKKFSIPIEMHPFAADATFNMPIEMVRLGRQMRPPIPHGRGQGTYIKQFDTGF